MKLDHEDHQEIATSVIEQIGKVAMLICICIGVGALIMNFGGGVLAVAFVLASSASQEFWGYVAIATIIIGGIVGERQRHRAKERKRNCARTAHECTVNECTVNKPHWLAELWRGMTAKP